MSLRMHISVLPFEDSHGQADIAISEPTLVTAAVNNLAHIIKTRPPLASKVLGAAMAFNPFQRKQVTVESRLMMLSMEKTIRALLLNIARFELPA